MEKEDITVYSAEATHTKYKYEHARRLFTH